MDFKTDNIVYEQYPLDRVYMKKIIKSHRILENHPNLVFGIIICFYSIAFVASICISSWLTLIFLLLAIPLTIWVIRINDNINLTKSSAFVERNGVFYYIRLGYLLDYQQPGVPLRDKKVALAAENMNQTRHIQAIREHQVTFSHALTNCLEMNASLPANVIEFCEMRNCKLEQQTAKWIWLSYDNRYTNYQRVTRKFRNVYDLPFA